MYCGVRAGYSREWVGKTIHKSVTASCVWYNSKEPTKEEIMGLFALKYKIKNRWINTGRVDENGDDIKIVNPDPTVAVLAGHWSQRTHMNDRHIEHELFRVSSTRFREMTGIVVYGGNIGARGIIKAYVNDDVHRLIMERAGRGKRRSNRNSEKS